MKLNTKKKNADTITGDIVSTKMRCKFKHFKEICQNYRTGKKCTNKQCENRHPKTCKWWKRGNCRQKECDFLHDTLACGYVDLTCISCKNNYIDETCVVGNTCVFLCLNCDGWIQRKEHILNPGWSLYDNWGQLRSDI